MSDCLFCKIIKGEITAALSAAGYAYDPGQNRFI